MKSFVKCRKITKNKSLEIQSDFFNKNDWELFKISIDWSLKGDHCGFTIELSIYKILYFHFKIYDNRHYDWKNGYWLNSND